CGLLKPWRNAPPGCRGAGVRFASLWARVMGAGGGGRAPLRGAAPLVDGAGEGRSFAAMVMRTLPPFVSATDPFDLVRNESRYSPGANWCSTTLAHWPVSSALVVATTSPLASTATSAFGGARPANTEAPSGSIRATSNFELSGAV